MIRVFDPYYFSPHVVLDDGGSGTSKMDQMDSTQKQIDFLDSTLINITSYERDVRSKMQNENRKYSTISNSIKMIRDSLASAIENKR